MRTKILILLCFMCGTVFSASTDCVVPTPAQVGANVANNNVGDQWFIYKNTSSDWQLITAVSCGLTSANTLVKLYKDCTTLVASNDNGCGFQSVIQHTVSAGDSIYIMWDDATSSALFTWVLEVEIVPLGGLCVNPISAVVGTNYGVNTDVEQWFSYTNTSDTLQLVAVSGNEDTYVSTYADCQKGEELFAQNTLIFSLNAGETKFIRWTAINEWNLSIRKQEPGDLCGSPIAAKIGTNSNARAGEWTAYVNNATHKVALQVQGEEGAYGYVYIDCGEGYEHYIDESKTFVLSSGDVALFQWYTTSTWQLQVSAISDTGGLDCSIPITAVEGTNQTDNAQGSQWFVYTNTYEEERLLLISSCGFTNEDTYLELYTDCGQYGSTSDDFCDSQSSIIYRIGAGETIYLLWKDSYTSSSFTWTISSTPVNENTCLSPIVAVEGVNEVNNALGSRWYVYTNNSVHSVSVTAASCGFTNVDTYLAFYSNCETLLADNDDDCSLQSSLTALVPGGGSIYILWSDVYTSSTYNWSLESVVVGVESTLQSDFFIHPTISDLGIYTFSAEAESVNVWNVQGELVNSAMQVSEIDLSNANAGVYFLVITQGNRQSKHKLIKQ